MKKHETIESLLSDANNTALTASERATMREELRAYATYHQPAPAIPPLKTRIGRHLSLMSKFSVAAVVVLMVSIGTGAASTQSLPGHTLYALKVDVVEPLFGLGYFSGEEQLHYQEILMERRLSEMQTLSSAKLLTVEEATILSDEIHERGGDVSELLQEEESGQESGSIESLETVSNIVSILRTQEILEDKQFGQQSKTKIEETEESISLLYEEELTDFLTESPEEVTGYIESVLTELEKNVVENDGDVTGAVEQELTEYLEDVSTALEEGNLGSALKSVSEAEQVFEVSRFFGVELETATSTATSTTDKE